MLPVLNSPLGPTFAIAIACFCAWKAANLLGANNVIAAVVVGALFAVAGPYFLGDLIAAGLADYTAEASNGDEAIGAAIPAIGFGMSRMGFALIGVLAWCGLERSP